MLHEAAQRTMGQPAADALLRGLPPVDWREFATKSDLAVLRTDLTLEFTTGMKALEDKLVDRFDTKLDTKIGALDAKIESKTGKLNRKINRKFKELDKKIGDLDKAIRAQGRWQTKLTITLFIALLTVPPYLPFGRTTPAPTPAPAVSPATPSPGADLSTAPPRTGFRGMGAH